MDKLEPCPFCGEKEDFETIVFPDGSFIYSDAVVIACRKCGAMGPLCSTEEYAVKYWNIRYKDAIEIANLTIENVITATKQ